MPNWVFAFGPNKDGYYVSNGSDHKWGILPDGLQDLLNDDEDFTAEKVTAVTLFPNGGYFVRGDRVETDDVPSELTSLLQGNSPTLSISDALRIDHDKKDKQCFGVLMKEEYIHQSMPDNLKDAVLRASGGSGTKVYVGYDSTFVCTWDGDGQQKWESAPSLSANVTNIVNDADRIETLWISPYDSDAAFLVQEDGQTKYWLPQRWRSTVDKLDS